MSIDDRTVFGKHGPSQLDEIIAEIEAEAATVRQKMIESKTMASKREAAALSQNPQDLSSNAPQTIFYVSSDRRIFTKLDPE